MSTEDATHFANLVRNMLEDKLGPIHDRLAEGDQRFERVERALHNLADAISGYRQEFRQLSERLTRLEGQHSSRHPRDSMPSETAQVG